MLVPGKPQLTHLSLILDEHLLRSQISEDHLVVGVDLLPDQVHCLLEGDPVVELREL